MSNNNGGMVMVMSMMMSMLGFMVCVPICIFIVVWVYRKYGKGSMSAESGTLTSDPGAVAESCVVLMNNTPTDNPNGKTERICLRADETNRHVDLTKEFKYLHDELSAVRVGKGLYLDLYEHKDYGGGYLRLDGDTLRTDEVVDLTKHCITTDNSGSGSCSSGGASWNDNVSSFQIVRKTQ